MTADHRRRIHDTARRVFGHEHLLPGQAEATLAALEGHDVLFVSPTGSGKSLVYQLAGLLMDGPTLVVSPLLALQHDQVEGLEQTAGEAGAVRISSAETDRQRAEALERVASGEAEFLFLAPEQLANPEVRDRVAALRPSLVAVDEAHCVSAWGHDFRPDYFRLGELLAEVGEPRVIAMTATAAPPVRDDIRDRLRMRDVCTVVTGFARDNLELSVERAHDEAHQRDVVLQAVGEASGPGIVYCRTRPAAEEYAAALAEQGRRTAVYHAGLSGHRRQEAHEAFMADAIDTVVATSAFGMGIDKPNVRWVVHAQVPESPDTYYQEVGRAGRDGEPATGLLVYRPEDLALGHFFSGGVPKRADVEAVVASLEALGALGVASDPRAVAERAGFGPRKAGRILNLLDLARHARPDEPPVEGARAIAETHRQLERSRVEMMRTYAETERCRAEFLVGYFGERVERCGVCDNCVAGVAPERAEDGGTTAAQTRVVHPEFGPGVVTDVEEDRLTVLFDEVGYRTLSRALVEEHGLLDPADH